MSRVLTPGGYRPRDIVEPWRISGAVPCNGCRLCCHKDAVRLLPGDNPDQYQTAPHPLFKGELMLAHKANKDCIYLGAEGCEIYDTRPLMCQQMDCRNIARNYTYTEARKFKGLHLPVWKRGKELIKAGKQ